MSLPLSLVSASAVLLGTVALAQPQPGGHEKVERVIVLKEDAAPTVQPLRVAPQVLTLVLFDAPVVRESVDTEALRPFFTRLEVNDTSLVLKPTTELRPGVRPRLSVRFEGGVPRKVDFELMTVPDVVDTQVEVRREEQDQARLRAALTELQGRCAATEAGLAPLRARCAMAGLAGLFVSGEMDPEEGVQAQLVLTTPTAQGVSVEWTAHVYRTGDSVMVGLKLGNPRGQAPWGPGPALLTRLGADGQSLGEVRRLPVALRRAVEPGQSAWVAVQWEEPPDTPAAAVRLEIQDEGGRGLRWERLPLRSPGGGARPPTAASVQRLREAP